MAAAVQVNPHLGGPGHHSLGQYESYANGMSVLEDSDDGDHVIADDMEAYYAHHDSIYQQQQQQYQMQQHHMVLDGDYHHADEEEEEEIDDEDMYSDTSEESVLPDENIDFSLIYALHTFLATVEGQASVVKGDSLLLLDDANSYWWLVRVLKTEDVGYIPAENVETPYERLARLNKHRNVDIAAPTDEEKAIGEPAPPRASSPEGKLKSLMGGWRRQRAGAAPEPAASVTEEEPERSGGRRVVFAPPTYHEHPGVTWSSDEEDEDDDHDDPIGAGAELDDGLHDSSEDVHEQIANGEHGLHDFEAEPDDGIEWAQDAVEAHRAAAASATAEAQLHAQQGPLRAVPAAQEPMAAAHEMATQVDHFGYAGQSESASIPEEAALSAQDHSVNNRAISGDSAAAAVAGVAAAGTLAAAATAAATASTQHGPEPPQRSPSPSAPHSALARANPTPPPHRAPVPPSPIEATQSPELSFSTSRATTETPEPASTPATVATPSSSDIHPASTPPTQYTVSPTSGQRSITPLTPDGARTVRGMGSPLSGGFRAAAPQRPPRRIALRYEDALNTGRVAALVRARAANARRTTSREAQRASRPAALQDSDPVQHTYYGDRPELDTIQPDIRACFVHVLAKMDAFDKDIDDLLGSLAPPLTQQRTRTPSPAVTGTPDLSAVPV